MVEYSAIMHNIAGSRTRYLDKVPYHIYIYIYIYLSIYLFVVKATHMTPPMPQPTHAADLFCFQRESQVMMTQSLDTFFRFGEGQLRKLLEENS